MGKRLVAVELLLKLINTIFTLLGLSIGIYGIYCLTKWNEDSSFAMRKKYRILFGTSLLVTHASGWLSNKLPNAWFIYLLLVIGASVIVISCFGCVGAATRSPCCLCFYTIVLGVLFVAQLGAAGFMFVNQNWKQDMPHDISGRFNSAYKYLNKNWNIIRWIILGGLILEVIAVALAMWLRCAHNDMSNFDAYERVTAVNVRQRIRRNNQQSPSTTEKLQTGPTPINV